MALATDANISRLQQMFPTVEGDVIAIVLNDCGNNVEQCINHLLEMSGDNAGPTHQQDNWPSVSQSSTATSSKKPTHNKRTPRKRSPVPQSRHSGGTGNKAHPSSNRGDPSFQEGNGKKGVESPQSEEVKEKQQSDYHSNPGGGVANKKPLLLVPPPPRGPPPLGNIPPRPPRPPHNQSQPNWQYYSGGGRPIYAQPMFGTRGYGGGQQHELPPRIIAPSLAPHGGVMFRPSGQFGTSGPPPPRGIIPIGPNGAPLIRGGIVLRAPGASMVPPPRGGIPFIRPGGMPLAYNGRTFVPNGTPLSPPTAASESHNTNFKNTANTANQPPQATNAQTVQETAVARNRVKGSYSPVSHSHTSDPPPHGSKWPVEIESETGTEWRRGPPDHREGGDNNVVDMLKETGREWLSWTKGSSHALTENKLVLLRGLPGSGKSTLAREIAGQNGIICSTDDFFYKNGRYVFEASKLGECHDLNKGKAREAMVIENTPVVIDNTNTSSWEMKPYVEMAHSMGYKVEIVETSTRWRFNPSELARRNSHGVPQDKIEKMLERYEHRVTVDTILASQKPTRERVSHSFSKRRENNGRGGHVTGHMTPAHPHYARRFQSHKPPETSKPMSSHTTFEFTPTSLKVLASDMSSSSSIGSLHSSPNITSPSSNPGSAHAAPRPLLRHPPRNTSASTNSSLSHTVPSSSQPPSHLSSKHTAPNSSHISPNIGSSPSTATSDAAPNLCSPPKPAQPTISSSTKQQTAPTVGKFSTSSHSLPSLAKNTDSISSSGRNSTSPFSPPPPVPHPASKLPPANSNTQQTGSVGESESESRRGQSLTLSTGSTADPLSLFVSKPTKEAEEQRAAKMSKIWGDGKLSDDTEAHLDRETRTVWGAGVWGGLSSAVQGGKGATTTTITTTVGSNWDQLGSGNGLVWSHLDSVRGEAVSDPVEGHGLVGHPLPCEFGPIGKQTKPKQDTKTDDSATKNTETATNGTTVVESQFHTALTFGKSSVSETKENGKHKTTSNGSQSQEKVNDTGKVRHLTRNGSSSAELWVSAETENWPYEEPSDSVFQEGSREESLREHSAGTLAPSLHNHTHNTKSHLSNESNPSTSSSLMVGDSSSFEDPAIVNLVKQSKPQEGGTHMRDPSWDIDPELENQEPLFAPPSSETSPEQKKSHNSSSSDCLSLLLSPSLLQPAAPATNLHLNNRITHSTDTHLNSRKTTAPTDVYFNSGVDAPPQSEGTTHIRTVSNTAASEMARCSTPTPIPAGDEEEEELEGGLVMEAGREDFFPSAFESDRQTLAPGFCLSDTGEVPNNDVTVTSSYKAGVVNGNPSSLPVTCVSTSPAESGNTRARRSLWPSSSPSGEDGGREKEGEPVLPLEGSPLNRVPETSGEYVIGTSSGPAGDEELTGGAVPSAKEAPNAESDLAFLVGCFPDLSRPFLKKLLLQSEGNVEEAVSTALVSSVVSPTQPPVGGAAGDILNWSPLALDSFYLGGGLDYWSVNDGSSAASVTSESEMEGGGGGEVWESDDEDECMNDEEIARLVQEQLDLEASSEEATGLWKLTAAENERREEDDENLVLRLSRSLASQLQHMFGSVDKHLPVEGELRDDDMKVLLSERAARQIWQKWIDTLEAKKVEIQLNKDSSISRAQSTPGGVVSSPDSRLPDRSSTEPEPLTQIMNEQSAQQTSTKQVRKVVMAACNKSMAKKMRLEQLYGRFRSLDKDTIEYVLFKNNFNFSLAAAELEREKAREEGVDGSSGAVSESGPTSFAGTAAKLTARPSDGTHTHTRSPSSRRRRRLANRTKQQQQRINKEVAVQSLGGAEDAPTYDDLRAEAALHAKLRSEAFQKAAQARSLKQGEVALYYAQKGHSHTEKMKEANSRAAALILHLHNDLSSQFLDLHGLYVEEALAALQGRLQSTTDQPPVLHVITGKGLHSRGEARIKPAVIGYLSSKNYRFEELPGRLKVRLS